MAPRKKQQQADGLKQARLSFAAVPVPIPAALASAFGFQAPATTPAAAPAAAAAPPPPPATTAPVTAPAPAPATPPPPAFKVIDLCTPTPPGPLAPNTAHTLPPHGAYASLKDDQLEQAIAAHIKTVLIPLANAQSQRVMPALAALLLFPALLLARFALSFFSASSRRVLAAMHNNCVPSFDELSAMVLANSIADGRLKGGYLCLARPSETDGGNLVKPGTWLAYIGKGTGLQGIVGRVSQHQMLFQNKAHRLKNASTHYKTVYGDFEYARLANSPLPTQPSASYYVLFELPLDVQEEVTMLCESIAITFANCCQGPVYRKVAKVPANKTHAFLGLNVATGLENFGYNGPSFPNIPQAGPSNNADAALGPSNGISERDKADLAFYKSYLSKGGFATNEIMRKRNLKQVTENYHFETKLSIANTAGCIYFPRLLAKKRLRIYFNQNLYSLVGVELKTFNARYNQCKVLVTFTFREDEMSSDIEKWTLSMEFIQEGYSTVSIELVPRKPKVVSANAIQQVQGYIDDMIAKSK